MCYNNYRAFFCRFYADLLQFHQILKINQSIKEWVKKMWYVTLVPRTTLTLPRRETIAIQQLLRHYPFMADVFPPPATRAPPARRRRSPASFRRTVYRHNLWARPLPDFTGRFRTCTPEFYRYGRHIIGTNQLFKEKNRTGCLESYLILHIPFAFWRYNDTQIHRLVPWLNRELHYLLNENIGHISYVMARILELLPQHHINSAEFREALHRYFGDRTEHFLHELYCFASTPYDMTGYDRNVQYTTDSRISTMVNEVISSSDSEASVDSDIVMVSSSEPAEPPPGPSRFPVPTYPQSHISQPATNSVIPIETISQSDTDDDSSEVMVVGYIKPPQERTPEIVDLLGSDSDVIVQDIPQPEPARPAETQEQRTVPSVKLTLKRHLAHDSGGDMHSSSDSDDSSYRPPPPRRRRARAHSADTSDTCRSTPPRDAPPSCSSSPASPPSPSTAPTSSCNDDTDDSKYLLKKKSKKSSKESATSSRDRRKNKKRSSHSHHKEKRNAQPSEKDKRSKRKSYSGKGVKSSNKTSNSEYPVPAEQALPALDQPSTSGTSKRDREKRKAMKERKRQRRHSRENRRLRSVVNVMYNSHKNTDESNSSATCSNLSNVTATINRSDVESTPAASDSRARTAESPNGHNELWTTSQRLPDTSSDSEDNLPLNLTLQKLNPFPSS